jgi:peptidoglycan hydrolase-like protein with peptidoglycan-binding domain
MTSMVQRALRDHGYDKGSITGFIGKNTAEAIERFQIDHGLPVRPVADRFLLNSIQQSSLEPR